MPPSSPPTLPQRQVDTSYMLAHPKPDGEGEFLAREKRSGMGPIVGTVIIIILLAFGGLYFWGASMNRQEQPLPFIPGDPIPQDQ